MRVMDGIRWLSVALGLALTLGAAAQAQPAARSSWDGVYATAQADRGAAAYAANCGFCHGATMNGTGEAKALTGPEFLSNWDGLTLGDLFERIRTTMPMDKPATLSREIYADVLAYLLKFNGFPAGEQDLDRRTEVLASIRIDAFKPTAAATGQAVSAAASAPAVLPNPYLADAGFFQMPPGRTMGSSSGVAVDGRGHVWVAERCGANSCANSALDPILEKIAALASVNDLAPLVAELHTIGVSAFFQFGSQADFKDASVEMAIADQGGLGLEPCSLVRIREEQVDCVADQVADRNVSGNQQHHDVAVAERTLEVAGGDQVSLARSLS